MVLETAGLNTTELNAYCWVRGLYLEQVKWWRQASQDAHQMALPTLKVPKEFERLLPQDHSETKRFNLDVRRKEKTLAQTVRW